MANGDYTAPVADYAFLLKEVFGTDIVARSTEGAMTADDMLDAIEAGGEMASEVFAPLDRNGDVQGAKLVDGNVQTPDGFKEAYATYVEAGWVSAGSPESAGGDGLPSSVQGALSEFWSAANSAFSLAAGLSAGAINSINTYGSQEIKETYLPKLVSGEWTGTMNLTEPQAGTDLGAITTIARDNGDGSYSISGQKIFITWGDHDVAENIIHLVLARTEGAPEGHRGLSLFVAPKFLLNADGTPGERNNIVTVSLEDKLGIHGSPTAQLQYENATGYLVGELHQGLQGMFVMMNDSRINIGIQGLGIADRAYQRAAEYAAFRVQGPVIGRDAGATIGEHPDVRRLLLSMSSSIHAMRAFSVLVGDMRDRAAEGDNQAIMEFFVPLLKSWATEESVRIASDAIQVHGGMGFIEETGAAQHYRDARITPIYEGTTAIQSNDLVGRKILRDNGKTLQQVLGMVQEQVTALQGIDNPVAQRTAERLGRALGSAVAASQALAGFAQNPRDAFAVSVPLQRLLSLVMGGWMHALIIQATLAHETLTELDEQRLLEADFFGAHHLSEVHSLREIVENGEIV
ncbi:acyl-CoA dehydrogenase [Leucobacter chinensis]|uniref:acyl-CoA dehydrogenase n=1 Tax=Leucobacter chinensis TaxID=2851010 RepID=UPI001C232CC1|nr:acyl-CoA dehydrogenase [Leucobacter chinensis]